MTLNDIVPFIVLSTFANIFALFMFYINIKDNIRENKYEITREFKEYFWNNRK